MALLQYERCAPSPRRSFALAERRGVLGRDAEKASSSFSSHTKRFDSDAPAKFASSVPPPGAYDTSRKWRDAKVRAARARANALLFL